ncbi:hypothetical protein BJV74DRAFT_890396 [Russula compacta]|nr:hypothetical protein BJV74DRAFT_890396 [Russula compacta]
MSMRGSESVSMLGGSHDSSTFTASSTSPSRMPLSWSRGVRRRTPRASTTYSSSYTASATDESSDKENTALSQIRDQGHQRAPQAAIIRQQDLVVALMMQDPTWTTTTSSSTPGSSIPSSSTPLPPPSLTSSRSISSGDQYLTASAGTFHLSRISYAEICPSELETIPSESGTPRSSVLEVEVQPPVTVEGKVRAPVSLPKPPETWNI